MSENLKELADKVHSINEQEHDGDKRYVAKAKREKENYEPRK